MSQVTDNVPSAIPVEYNGHYTVLGKLDVTEGLEPNTKVKGFYLFGHLEVVRRLVVPTRPPAPRPPAHTPQPAGSREGRTGSGHRAGHARCWVRLSVG